MNKTTLFHNAMEDKLMKSLKLSFLSLALLLVAAPVAFASEAPKDDKTKQEDKAKKDAEQKEFEKNYDAIAEELAKAEKALKEAKDDAKDAAKEAVNAVKNRFEAFRKANLEKAEAYEWKSKSFLKKTGHYAWAYYTPSGVKATAMTKNKEGKEEVSFFNIGKIGAVWGLTLAALAGIEQALEKNFPKVKEAREKACKTTKDYLKKYWENLKTDRTTQVVTGGAVLLGATAVAWKLDKLPFGGKDGDKDKDKGKK